VGIHALQAGGLSRHDERPDQRAGAGEHDRKVRRVVAQCRAGALRRQGVVGDQDSRQRAVPD
jgi:hypothetical protein